MGRFPLLQLPNASVGQSPYASVCINEEWLPILLALIERLEWATSWQPNTNMTFAQKGAFDLALALVNAPRGDCTDAVQPCLDYLPNAGRINYEPNHPFNTPDYTPPGYLVPPWYTNPAIPLPGVQPGDAMVNFAGMPAGTAWISLDIPGLLAAGLPRFRVSGISAGATVELHLITVPQGGNALITIDGNPLPVFTVELNADLTALPAPELPWVSIHEITVPDDNAAHFIDVTFVPVINNETGLPVFFGGGLRKVVICGEYTVEECLFEDVWQDENNPCQLWKRIDGVDSQFANLRLCTPQIRITPGVGGAPATTEISTDGTTWTPVTTATPPIPPRSDGATENDKRCLAAANAANVIKLAYEEIRTRYATSGDVIALAAFALVLLGFIWVFPPALIVVIEVIGLMIAVGGFSGAVLDADDVGEIQCILYCNASVGAGNVVTFDFAAVMSEMQAHSFLPVKIAGIMLPILTEDGLNRAGATTAITSATCDCPECDNEWCYTFDFAQGNGGFAATIHPAWGNLASYSAGVGWTARVNATRAGIPDRYSVLEISKTISGRITSIAAEGSFSYGVQAVYYQSGGIFKGGASLIAYSYPTPGLPLIWTGDQTFDNQSLKINLGIGYATAGLSGGSATLQRLTLRGTGVNPFGVDNCT